MLATRKVKTSCHDSRFNVWCAEIRLSTVSKAALDSDQAQNCQPLDNHDPITKLVGPTKAARAAVADEGADKGAAAVDATGHISDRGDGNASPDRKIPASAAKKDAGSTPPFPVRKPAEQADAATERDALQEPALSKP